MSLKNHREWESIPEPSVDRNPQPVYEVVDYVHTRRHQVEGDGGGEALKGIPMLSFPRHSHPLLQCIGNGSGY
jgi:hypothetical protein